MAKNKDTNVSGSGLDAQTLERFGLAKHPFARSHDPGFLLRSKPLRMALDAVRVALDDGDNIVVVLAPRGAGKTALMDAMHREFKDSIRTALIHEAGASWAEIGQQMGEQLRLSGGRISPGAMSADDGPVHTYRVIVNRAECLSVDSLKHLAAYLELDGGAGKRLHKLQLIALADPESAPDARLFDWLDARHHSRVDLGALDNEQIRRYVARRVQIAQDGPQQLFSSDALERICQLTDGRPGTINALCGAALELAASRGSNTVDAETIGTASRRGASPVDPAATSAATAAPVASATVDAASTTPDPFDAPMQEPTTMSSSPGPRVEVLEQDAPGGRRNTNAAWAAICALLLGVIFSGGAFFYLQEPPPVPEPVTQIIEVPVEVEKIVEVPVEVVKVVEVPVPVKATPRPPKPRPAKIAKPAPPPAKPAPVVEKKPTLGPIPPAAEVLERAFAKARPGDHTRKVELLEHGANGVVRTRELTLSRLQQKNRTLTLGVVTHEGTDAKEREEHRFLSVEKAGQLEDDRFGFRPAHGEVEPLRAGQGRDPFAGTSFRYSDFRVRRAAQYVFHGIERSKVDGRYFYVISAKPRYKAPYQRAEFVVDALDEVLVEVHYFSGRGLRPYRVVQYPREAMELTGTSLVAMRVISRDFEQSRIDEARIVKLDLDRVPNRKLFSLARIQQEGFVLPVQ